MNSETGYQLLRGILPKDDLLQNEPAARHTSFRAGGPIGLLAHIRRRDDLRKAVQMLLEVQAPFTVIGNGSNLLVSDKGYPGVLLHLTGEAFQFLQTETDEAGVRTLQGGAAVSLAALAHFAAEHGIAGFVPLSGIPGTVGGALTMNAGAYGGEMKDVVTSVQALDLSQAHVPEITLSAKDMAFDYRTSIAAKRPCIFLSASFAATEQAAPEQLKEEMRALAEQRQAKQPLEFPSAGSTFKRPPGAFAARLIEEAGCKGRRVGGAQVSEKHAGFVVNTGDATATDILTLMREVRAAVETESGFLLEPEVRILGESF